MRDKNSLTERYLNEYRKKLEEVKKIRVAYNEIAEELNAMTCNLNNAESELYGMKRVISKMIDEDLDPIEAKLSIDDSDDASIWQKKNDVFDITCDSSISYGNFQQQSAWDTAVDTSSLIIRS